MAQVVSILRETRLFAEFSVRVIVTHTQGGTLRRAAIYLRAMASFLRVLATRQAALVHAHVAAHGSFWRKATFLTLARIFRVPTILHLHASQFRDFFEKDCGRFQRRVIRHVLEHASTVIVLSKRLQAYIGTIAPRAKIVTIHNFVDISRFETETKRVPVERSSSTLLFLGDIGPRKGIYDLIRAMPEIVKSIPQARLVAGGKGDIKVALQLARELGVDDHVLLPGYVSGPDKYRLLAEAAIYVLPSYNEGVPISILEAMSVGLPIVTTPVGGIPDVIRDGEEGFLVTPGSVDELARRIIQLLSNEDLRKGMGESAWRRLRTEYSPEVSLGALTALYQS
ncbi:MAG TPA: glycosyltransferase family 4 protein, partial [Candidatus Paceibacterota bacterium]|nr:glycosyltransferase family 4 protein [Candidatus Paceibacterota bacterium]